MKIFDVKAALRRRTELLQRGYLVRFGPLALVSARRVDNLATRLHYAERALVEEGHVISLPLETPKAVPESRRRSVVFIHHSYYNFYYLAAALRRRGWNALSVSLEDPNGPNSKYYHGEDINLFDSDPDRYKRNLIKFYEEVENGFRMVHFYGMGHMSFFPELFDTTRQFNKLPLDFIRLCKLGVKIGYSVCGCLDGVSQESVRAWSGVCQKCVWENQPHVCADNANLAWGHKVHMLCDLVATEGFPALDWQGMGDRVFREPLTTALDPDFWRPDLKIPETHRLKREPGELIVYHGVGNFASRARDGRDIKGTGAIMAAIERLRAEGVPVRLEFVTDLPNKEVRLIQVQADIIIDQLNHGRYGAQAREGMMLGRPTICYIKKEEPSNAQRLESIETCPLVSATEGTVYEVLKDLLLSAEKRRAIGAASRAFALKWHSADACAERFERVYDRLMQGMSPAHTPALVAAE